MWKTKTWTSRSTQQELIDELEVEFLENPTELLAKHILQLKEAWGMVCVLPQVAA